MAIYNLTDPRHYLKLMKDIGTYMSNRQTIEVKKFHPVQTDKQQRFIHFMLSYWAWKNGETFYDTLQALQKNICPVPFYTGQKDKRGNSVYKPLSVLNTADASSVIRNFLDYASMNGTPIPEPDDNVSIEYCMKELESSEGWV